MMNASLADNWFDSAQTLAENRALCRVLGLHKKERLMRQYESDRHDDVQEKHVHGNDKANSACDEQYI